MTKEEKDRLSNQRGLIVPQRMTLDRVQGDGRQGVPVFPSNFSNIGPSEQKAGQTRFAGGAPATMGIGGMNSAYPSSLGLSGGAFGSGEMGSRDGSPLRLPQATFGPEGISQIIRATNNNQLSGLDRSVSFANEGGLRNEGYNFRQPVNSLALPPQTSIPIGGGPVSMGYNQVGKTQEQQGKIAIQVAHGTIYATPEQKANMMTPRSVDQQSSRSPAEQQAMIADMKVRGAALGQERVANMEEFFKQKRAEQKALRESTAEAAKSGMDPMDVRQARAAYNEKQPNSIAGIQRQYQEMLSTFNQPMEERIASVREPFGLPSRSPQPSAQSAFGGGITRPVGIAQPMGATGSISSGVMPPLFEPILNQFGGINMMETLGRSGQKPTSMLDKLNERTRSRMTPSGIALGRGQRNTNFYG